MNYTSNFPVNQRSIPLCVEEQASKLFEEFQEVMANCEVVVVDDGTGEDQLAVNEILDTPNFCMELIDLIHTADGVLRKLKEKGVPVDLYYKMVLSKNAQRGDYSEEDCNKWGLEYVSEEETN